MATRRNVRYTPLSTEDRDDGIGSDQREEDLRFAYNPKSLNRIPWKSICLALFLLLLGSLLLLLSYFIFTGHMEGDRSQAYGLLFLGLLSFLPGFLIKLCHQDQGCRHRAIPGTHICRSFMHWHTGFYETRVAYYSWRGAPGYTFSSIPSY